MKGQLEASSNRASMCRRLFPLTTFWLCSVWESEEWLQQHVKPLAQSGGSFRDLPFDNLAHQYPGVQGRIAQQGEQEDTQNKSDEDMEE